MALTTGEITFISINGLILFWCVFSNTCVIGIVLCNKKMRNPTNMLICNLALSDILLGGIVLPQNLHDISHTTDFFEGEFACRVVNFLPVLLIVTSIYTLVAMSYERHRAIVISGTSAVLNKTQMAKIIGIIWCGSALCTIPSVIEYSIYTVPYTVTTSNLHNQSEEAVTSMMQLETTTLSSVMQYQDQTKTYTANDMDSITTIASTVSDQGLTESFLENNIRTETRYSIRCGSNGVPWAFSLGNGLFLLLVAYIVPTVLIWTQYYRLISYIVEFSKRQPQTGAGSTSFIIFKNKVQIVKMLVIVAALFELCWLPYFSLLIFAKSTGQDDSTMLESWPNMLRISLSSFSVSYNAVLYIVYNAHFKRGFAKILFPCKERAGEGNKVTPSMLQTGMAVSTIS